MTRRQLHENAPGESEDLPEGWAEAPLGCLGSWNSGATPSKSNPTYWKGSVPWVSPKDLKSDFITDSIDHVSLAGVAAANLKIVPAGTLLFVVRGMILAKAFPVALTRTAVTLNQDIRALTPHPGIDAEYLFRALQHEATSILFKVKEATHGTLRLDSPDLQRWSIRVPPHAEQLRIAQRTKILLDTVNTARDRVMRAGAAFGLQVSRTGSTPAIVKAILARALAGELVPTEADLARRERRSYEPASELLRRIRADTLTRRVAPERKQRRGKRPL